MLLTIAFANIFSYVSETQRRRAAEQEQELELERDRLALLVHATQAGFTDWDTKANVVIYSERFKEMLGYPADFDTATWRSFFELMHADDHDRVRSVFRGLMREKRKPGLQPPGEPLEYRLKSADGAYVWVKAASLAQVDGAGRIRRFITSFQDVTKYHEQQARLRDDQRRLDLVVRAARAGIVDWDGRTHATYYSPRFREILGHAPGADTSGWPDYFRALIHPDDRERVIARFRQYILGTGPEGPAEYYEPEQYRLQRADGSYVWVQSQGVCVRDATGFVTRFIAAITDVTERRDADKFSADIFDALPIGLAMRDLQGRYVFVNRTWEEYTGAKREDVIGKTVRDRAPAEEAARVEAEDREALSRGPDAPAQLKDLSFAGKRYVLTRTVITDASGAPRGVVVASLDTTERSRIEERLAGEQRRASLLMRAANVGILDWDGVKRTVYYSPRFKEILRYPADADTSKWPDYFELVHPEDRERVHGSFRAHIRAGGPDADVHDLIQYRLRRADGSYVWVEAFGASVRDARGFAERFIASISDISERRFQEEALRSAVRLREEVERMSRHDLKTPINSVIAMARLLREDGRLAREDADMLASIERAGYRVLNMVNLSLDLFRMEQGSYEFRPRPVDLAEVARRVAADLESQAASKRVRVEVRSGGASAALAEEPLCYSLLANLIKNAIEAAPDDTAVTVAVQAQPDRVLAVQVHNAGAVLPEMRQRFFQKYATAGKSGGTGLGAYSARLLARVMQGDITFRTSEEEGTTLTVKLNPAAEASKEVVDSGKTKKKKSIVAAAGRRVLIVDDDEFNRIVLRRFLPSPPFEVELAVNGRAALDAAKKSWPDAVLLDLEMPVMDGYETATRLRELERAEGRKRCTIVAISSNDEDAIIRRALAAGCDHYQVKPAPRETLLRLLGDQLAAQAPQFSKPPAADSSAADPVEVDADLEAALPAFLASRREALQELAQALAGGERAAAKRLAHKLAGSFSLYGFRWAAAQCKALERAAPAGDAAELGRAAAAVREHLDTVQVRLRAAEAK
jgi:PAS domain S-box-containing protein